MNTNNVASAFTQRIAKASLTLSLIGLIWLAGVLHLSAQPISLVIARQTNDFAFAWNTTSGSFYVLQTSTNLLSGSWVAMAPLYASSNFLRWTDFNPPDQARFYRVALPGPQATTLDPAVMIGNGASLIYIHGYGLNASNSVSIGGIPISGLTFVSSTLLQGTLPNLAPGYYSVQVFDGLNQLVAVLTNGLQIVASGSSALKVEPPGFTPGDPSGSSCSRGAQNDPAGFFLFSGEVHSTATDLVIPGVGMDFIWSRSYRSFTGANTSQGNGWTFGYNISIQSSGTDVVLTDGNSRQDVYFHQPDGTYVKDGFMREGSFDLGGNFILTFPDSGTWTFNPLDSSPGQGKISAISDRNGNTMLFNYDGSGRLINVVDTLNRNIAINYDGNGFVSSLTDFSSRQVTYSYYQNGDAGGSFGDLKSVTSPAVTGTPNGNDFPSGKTTTYTYTKDSGDPNLDHKLLTITDPKGQTWLQNTYSTSTDPTAPEYGRVVNRILGETNEILMFSYNAVMPDPTNNFATQKTIVNDQTGNVKEYFYNSQNLPVIERAYTGRATPGVATTDIDNRPVGKLRDTDPDYFETRYVYNIDSLPTLITYPNGNMTQKYYELDFDATASRRTRANLRMEQTLPGPFGGDQTALVKQYEYDTDRGGCCGFNFVTKATDARGKVTLNNYDSHGNRIHTVYPIASIIEDFEYNARGQMTAHVWPDNGSNHRRRDTLIYYTSGPQNGYLQQSIIDSTSLALTVTYEYDARGNIVRIIDPRGDDLTNIVNELNQVVRQVSQQVTNQYAAFRYQQDTTYDANDKVIQTDVQNIDDHGVLQTNAYFTTTTAYDILNYPTNITQEVDATHNVVTQYAYDASHNRTLITQGQATSGADPFNTITTLYDERDLPYQEIRAQGSADQSTTQYDYDPDRNLIRTSQGLEDLAAPRLTTYAYDGYDRRTSVTDAMGNMTTTHCDASGNVLSSRVDGELVDLPGGTNNVRLAETDYTYDALNRMVQSDQAFFDTANGTNIAGGHAIKQTIYNANSQVLQTIDANNHAMIMAYDSANRRSLVTDPKGNSASYAYDADNNVVLLTEVDHSDLGAPAQTFQTTSQYDALDRLIQTRDNMGNTTQFTYDSRNNQVTLTDPRGNLTRYDYDGLNRLTTTSRFLTDSGLGSGNPASSIVTSQSWDDDSRLTGQTDANTNTTAYGYDSLDRQTLTVFADGTTNRVTYDVHDNVAVASDANGNVVSASYDLLNRATSKTITPGAGVLGATFENYQYDGGSRIVRGENDDSLVTRSYDSLSRVVHETQQVTSSGAPTRTLDRTYDGVGNMLSAAYPGGRVINRTYDSLNRQQTNSDSSGIIATYNYLGPTRVERNDYGNATRAVYTYDGVRRMTNSLQSVIATNAPIDSRSYTWDEANNQTAITDLLAPTLDAKSFAYDSVNRLDQSVTAVAGPTVGYGLDGVGNRLNVTGGTNAGTYFLNPADQAMNRYTTTPFDSRTYDANGNLTGTGQRLFVYDYRNRLLIVSNFDGIGNYTNAMSAKYDCFDRRIEKSAPGGTNRYYYANWQEIEEQNSTNGTVATYVWGRDIDDLLSMSRGSQKYFYHADDLGSIRKVTDASHNIVEQYRYDDYGTPSFFDGSGAALPGTQIGNLTLFAGRRYDPETGFYYNRTRYLEPSTGRFTTRDSIGVWGDAMNMGNAYTAEADNPWTFVDPMGTDCYGTCDTLFWRSTKGAKARNAECKTVCDEGAKVVQQVSTKVKQLGNSVKHAAQEAAKVARKVLNAGEAVVGVYYRLPGIFVRLDLIFWNHVFTWTPFKTAKPRPFYGNYCGQVADSGLLPDGSEDFSKSPIDDLDTCCKAHDHCASAHSVLIGTTPTERQCDRALCACVKKASYGSGSESWRNWEAARNDTVLTFCGRLY